LYISQLNWVGSSDDAARVSGFHPLKVFTMDVQSPQVSRGSNMGNKKQNASRGNNIGKGRAKARKSLVLRPRTVVDVSAPVSIGRVRSSISARSISDVSDPILGHGLRLAATELLCFVNGGTSASSGCLSYSQNAGFANQLVVSPVSFAGANTSSDILSIGAIYSFYRFRKIIFEYEPETSTSTALSFAFGYQMDGRVPDGSFGELPSYPGILKFQHCLETPVWQRSSLTVDPVPCVRPALAVDYKQSSGSPVGELDKSQGSVYGYLSGVIASTLTLGRILTHYVVDFFGKGAFNNVTNFAVGYTDEEKSALGAIYNARKKRLNAVYTTLPEAQSQPIDIRSVAGFPIALNASPYQGSLAGLPIINSDSGSIGSSHGGALLIQNPSVAPVYVLDLSGNKETDQKQDFISVSQDDVGQNDARVIGPKAPINGRVVGTATPSLVSPKPPSSTKSTS